MAPHIPVISICKFYIVVIFAIILAFSFKFGPKKYNVLNISVSYNLLLNILLLYVYFIFKEYIAFIIVFFFVRNIFLLLLL